MKPINLREDPVWKIYRGLALESEAAVKNFKRSAKRFRASEVSNCRRQLWYRLGGFVPLPKYPWVELVADAGNMFHDYFRHIAKHFGIEITGLKFNDDGTQTEDKFEAREFTYDGSTFEISCRPDGYLQFEDLDGKTVMEIKSMTTFKFDALQRAWRKGGMAGALEHVKTEHASYAWQGNATALIKDADNVLLVCIDRNLNRIGLNSRDFPKQGTWDPTGGERTSGAVWRVEEQDRGNILQKLSDVSKAIEAGTPPTPEYVDGSNECNQCPFWYACHGKRKNAVYPIPGVLQ